MRASLRREDREAFEELMEMCRSFASESSNATNSTIFEPMVISILIVQQKKIRELEYQFNEVLWQRICAHERQTPTSQNNQTTFAHSIEA